MSKNKVLDPENETLTFRLKRSVKEGFRKEFTKKERGRILSSYLAECVTISKNNGGEICQHCGSFLKDFDEYIKHQNVYHADK